MAALGDKGFEYTGFDHALNRPDRQTQNFGSLAGAEIRLSDVFVFHPESWWGASNAGFEKFACFDHMDQAVFCGGAKPVAWR